MNKLYYIVCDDKETNVFEGRYQGRTRGEALKFLKQSLGRKSLNGLVFTITEIPVPLLRDIVAEILAGGDGYGVADAVPSEPQLAAQVTRFDAFADAPEPRVTPAAGKVIASRVKPTKPKPRPDRKPAVSAAKVGNPGLGDDYWSEVRAHWEACRNIGETATHFGLSPNSVKTRAYREGWRK